MRTANQADSDSITADIAALNAHHIAIEPLHKLAFAGPVVEHYAPGTNVWLWDHYSTATIVAPADGIPGSYIVELTTDEGTASQWTYTRGTLRPAVKPMVFVWPSVLSGARN
jgi:hypothetical protein